MKGKNCVRGYQHMGRKCPGCRYYEDEKIHYQPQKRLSPVDHNLFLEALEEFEEWLNGNLDRTLTIYGSIDSVKPRFRKIIGKKSSQVHLDGYLVIFRRGFIDTTEFDDYFYSAISPHQQERLQLKRHDRLECKGILRLDDGRLLFERIHAVEFEERSQLQAWDNSQSLVTRLTASSFDYQPPQCQNCWFGALVDVIDYSKNEKKNRRELFCLKGISEPTMCYIRAIALKHQTDCPF